MVGITPAVWGCALGALLLALSAGAQAPNTDNARSPIGTNLAEVADWSTGARGEQPGAALQAGVDGQQLPAEAAPAAAGSDPFRNPH